MAAWMPEITAQTLVYTAREFFFFLLYAIPRNNHKSNGESLQSFCSSRDGNLNGRRIRKFLNNRNDFTPVMVVPEHFPKLNCFPFNCFHEKSNE